jgi:hypothetical protein
MPALVAIVGAIMSGVVYWFIYGKGMEQVDHWLNDRRNTRRSLAAREAAGRAPLKAMTERRDGAVALMLLIAGERGEPTPEQLEAIRAEMRDVLEFGADLEARLVVARHAVASLPSSEIGIADLTGLMQSGLTKAEFNQLFIMMRRVAALHGGPTESQDRLLALAERQLKPVS